MNIIQFDDRLFPWRLDGVKPKPSVISDCPSLDDWFQILATDWVMDTGPAKEPSGMFLINAHGLFTPDGTRQDMEGIEILKHIRLTPWLGEVQTWHAILYSHESMEQILRRKQNDLIILSGGVTFLRLPEAMDLRQALLKEYPPNRNGWSPLNNKSWPTQELPEILSDLSKAVATPKDCSFRPYVACDYAPPDSEHEISNWWGVRQLALAARKIAGVKNGVDLPSSVRSELKKLENKKAFFMAGGKSLDQGGGPACIERS